MIPTFMHIKVSVFNKMIESSKENPNDMDLGRAIRNIIRDYEDGKFNPPSDFVDPKDCEHDFVTTEYVGQSYGHCTDCKCTVFKDEDENWALINQ